MKQKVYIQSGTHIGNLLATLCVFMVITTACSSNDDGQHPIEIEQQSNLFRFADGLPLSGGGAFLKRTPTRLTMTLDARDLWPNQTYTISWMVFNNPEPCQNGITGTTDCGQDDLFDEVIGGSVLFADGQLSDGEGRSQFMATLDLEDATGCQPPFDDFGVCRKGLENPMGAEVHLVIRRHGEMLPELGNLQLETYAGGCTPETSFGAGNGPNECVDMQFAVFKP
ncbi:hypothetical protein [Negadavirga shengliensis]|uniref:Lipoprotein n=1 Tax=Negadavirga shengliensis TaxID=1389218 RepID=A0ABV9T254_9BACT